MGKGSAIFITGPTASGKTSLSVRLAEHLDTEIISADSRQVYHELNIGVARPEKEFLERVRHHLIASHSIHHPITVYDYLEEAMHHINHLLGQGKTPIVVGGTGLYIKALLQGLDQIPNVQPSVVTNIEEQYQTKGIEWLQTELKTLDPVYAREVDMQNARRLIRALSVIKSTEKPFSHFRKNQTQERPFTPQVFHIRWPRELLYDRINQRVDIMFEEGLLEEVTSLQPHLHLKALRSVGYQEFVPFFKNECSLEDVKDKIKQHSRNYAKRQETFIRNQLSAWSVDYTDAMSSILEKLKDST